LGDRLSKNGAGEAEKRDEVLDEHVDEACKRVTVGNIVQIQSTRSSGRHAGKDLKSEKMKKKKKKKKKKTKMKKREKREKEALSGSWKERQAAIPLGMRRFSPIRPNPDNIGGEI
jgi:hypothetical protein